MYFTEHLLLRLRRTKMTFKRTPEFNKDLKTLQKKWRTLEKDLNIAQSAITALYNDAEFYKMFFQSKKAAVISSGTLHEVVKMRLDCSSPGAKGLARIVFVFAKQDDQITLIEIYSKSEKGRENQVRIDNFLATSI